MEQITKIVSRSGNGAIVYVPSKWMNRRVNISLTDIDIQEELFYLLKDNLKNIIAIGIYGSYARGEWKEDSDIDILVVVDKKFELKPSRFDIHLIEINLLKEGLKKNPIIFYSKIKEIKAVFNEYLFNEFKRIKSKNFSWFIKTSKSAIEINKEFLKLDEKYANTSVIYSIMLRSRGIYIMNCIIKDKEYTNKGFLEYLEKLGFERNFIEEMYKVYKIEKSNGQIVSKLNKDKVYNFCEGIEKELRKYEKKKKS